MKSYLEQVMSPLLEKRQVPGDNNLTECTNDNYEVVDNDTLELSKLTGTLLLVSVLIMHSPSPHWMHQ